MGENTIEENASFKDFISAFTNAYDMLIDTNSVEIRINDASGAVAILTYTPYKSVDDTPKEKLKGRLELSVDHPEGETI